MSEFNNNNIENTNVSDNSVSNNIEETKTFTPQHTTVIVNEKKHKHGFARGLAIGLSALLICAAGSVGGTAATLYLLPKTSFFKTTPLYKTIAEDINTRPIYASPALSSPTTGLSIGDIAKKVSPAVVGVSVKLGGGFFGSQEGMGSGIIFKEDGSILTNYHVVDGATSVNVILNDGKSYAAHVINYDQKLDVAIIKLNDTNVKMPAVATLGTSKNVQVGDAVVAIGNPLGKELMGTVTSGIISAVNRTIQTENGSATYLQISAAINAGNSGGALVNTNGEIIGINSAKIGGDGVEGIGFAIPIDAVKDVMANIQKPIIKIGIGAMDVSDSIAKQYDVPKGVLVQQVQDFTPAQKAGIQQGDIIVKFDGKKIETLDDLNKYKAQHNIGDTVQIEVVRDKQTKTLSLKFTE